MIAINGQFPGPVINVTTNWNVVVNVKNNLDEPILFTWYVCAGMSQHYYLFGLWWLQSEWQCWQCCRDGVQQRRNSWQDGVLGTNCPIPSGWNWTYEFQVKDQIGSFFYFPSTSFQKAAGGFGGFIINNREVIPVPFGTPDGDITIFIGDWYTKSHKVWLIFSANLFTAGYVTRSLPNILTWQNNRTWEKILRTERTLECLMGFSLMD